MSAIEEVIAAGLEQLEAGEEPIARKLRETYEAAYRSVARDLELMLRTIEQARRDGEPVNPDWLRRQARYRRLMASIEVAYGAAGGRAATLAAQAQRFAAWEGYDQGLRQLEVTFGPGSIGLSAGTVPIEAVNRFVTATVPGSPLNQVFSRYGEQAREIIDQAIASGIVEGHSLRKTSAAISRRLAGRGTREAIDRIVRTESMRAFRGSQVDQYRRSGLVSQVRWVASLSARTCLYCLHMHGKVFPIDQPPRSQHPNCRCSLTPVPRDRYASLDRFFESGEDWMRRQPATVQLRMIGGNREALAAFRNGDLQLADFAGLRGSEEWGPSGQQRSGRAALVHAGIARPRTS